MTSDAGTVLHLINLRTNDNEGNDEYWRNAAKQILPFDNTSVTYHLEEGEAVPASIFAVSPDDDGGRPTRMTQPWYLRRWSASCATASASA